MKNKLNSMLKDLPVPTIDNDALSVSEMAKETGMSRCWVKNHCNNLVKSGKWERVFKLNGTRKVRAYRKV